MNIVLVIQRSSLVLWGAVIRDEGAKRSHTKWENIWKNTLKGKDLRVAVNLRTIEALMKKEVTHRKGDQKSRRNDIELEARKTKRKSIGDIHLRHHHQADLMTILMRVNKALLKIQSQKISIPWKPYMISWNIFFKIKRSRRISISTMFLKKFKVEIDQLWVHYRKFGRQLIQPDYNKRIHWRFI